LIDDCPSLDALQSWLDQDTDAQCDHDTISTHIDRCPSCQSHLDSLIQCENVEVIRNLARVGDALEVPPTDLAVELNSQGLQIYAEQLKRRAERTPPQIPGIEQIEFVAVGGMGVVYRGWDPQLKRVVAIKVLKAGQFDSSIRDRFLQEAQTIARIQQPSVVQIFETGETDGGEVYLILEWVEGTSLAAYLREASSTLREIAEIMAQTAEGIAVVHSFGLIHRDIKPSNLMLQKRSGSSANSTSDLAIRIIDFGLARQTEQADRMTQTGAVLGTPHYMSPEQAAGNVELTTATDIYGLGATMYEALTGATPFRGLSHQVIHQVLHAEPTAPRQINKAIPRDLETICLKAIAKEPRRRYATMQAFADDLRLWSRGEPIQARPTGIVERSWYWSHRNPVLASLLTLFAVTVLTGTISVTWLWRQAVHLADEKDQQARRANQLADDEQRSAAETLRANEIARQNFARAKEVVNKFYEEIYLKHYFDRPGLEEVRRKVRGDLIHYFEDYIKNAADDPEQKADVAQAYLRLARGMFEDNKAQSLKLYETAIPLLQELSDRQGAESLWTNELRTALLQTTTLLLQLGRTDESLKRAQQLVDIAKVEWTSDPTSTRRQGSYAAALGMYAANLIKAGKADQAYTTYQDVLTHFQACLDRDPGNDMARLYVGSTLFNLSLFAPDPSAALDWCLKSLDSRRKHIELNQSSRSLTTMVGKTLCRLSVLRTARGETEQAAQDFLEGRKSILATFAGAQLSSEGAFDLANADTDGLQVLFKLSRYEEAYDLAHQDFELILVRFEDDPIYLSHGLSCVSLLLSEALQSLNRHDPQVEFWQRFYDRAYPKLAEAGAAVPSFACIEALLIAARILDSSNDSDAGQKMRTTARTLAEIWQSDHSHDAQQNPEWVNLTKTYSEILQNARTEPATAQ